MKCRKVTKAIILGTLLCVAAGIGYLYYSYSTHVYKHCVIEAGTPVTAQDFLKDPSFFNREELEPVKPETVDAVRVTLSCHSSYRDLRVQIVDRYFGILIITFGFRKDGVVGVKMMKCAEDFLTEYNGWMSGRKA